MKLHRPFVALLALLLVAAASAPAMARGPHRAHFGVFIGPGYGPGYWPGYYYPPHYYYPPPYYPPVVVSPPRPTVYIEQGNTQSAEGNWWYYCADAKAYYPYVKECPAGWQRVSPVPAS